MTKQELLFKEIILKYHPDFRTNSQLKDLALKHPEFFNTERLVELTMAHVGGYEFLDEDGYDFSDYSDSKTASIGNGSVAVVGNILGRGKSGEPKVGDLRVVLYNPYKARLDYYFMPKAGWESIREYGDANKGKLRAKYSPDLDCVYKWRQWQCPDFETLAKTPSTIQQLNQWAPAATPRMQLFVW
jgi:hypothetical protein